MYLKKLKIGNVELKNNIILAPMAGITDLPFRTICKEYGAGLVVTEMASSKAILYNDEKTKKLLKIDESERPISAQIFGSDIESIKVATEYVNNFADIVDINMGCPAPKVVKNGDGSKLLQNLDLVYDIVKQAVDVSKVPVTVKIRSGWDKDNIVAVEAAKLIESAGASAIAIHGRTRSEFYTGKADLEIIKQVKQSVSIPVIGNGDIIDETSATHMFEYTGVDGIMLGRGTLGKPWIFKQLITYFETGNKMQEPSIQEKLNVILKHIQLEVEEKGEQTAVREMRKHIAWYIKKLPNASIIRQKVNTIETKKELIEYMQEYFNSLQI